MSTRYKKTDSTPAGSMASSIADSVADALILLLPAMLQGTLTAMMAVASRADPQPAAEGSGSAPPHPTPSSKAEILGIRVKAEVCDPLVASSFPSKLWQLQVEPSFWTTLCELVNTLQLGSGITRKLSM
ncbi:uncharacterized protein LOC121379910 [Gigantopelta aegis]|uniref:uncharacterized protein LOC121379910 n=1 Tax=Gigantopelta aegis TaxID=1735272 RepID=UPI001B88B2D9|nr:uncharacterized protein LOC121379910 [Gigantopelta aegis]